MSFQNLKKNSNSNVKSLSEQLAKMAKPSFEKDERLWTVSRDKAGNGFALIRFLPAADGEDVPFAKVFSHNFKHMGNWFIENCPTTIGQTCPCCASNTEHWNSGVESDKTISRDRKRKLNYFSNILVLSDPANKDNEGKVFIYKYGQKIFDKIKESMNPQPGSGEEPCNPFDFWTGRNFKLSVKSLGEFPNYDSSQFSAPSALFDGNDAKLENLWKQEYPLLPFVAPNQFKSPEDLGKKFDALYNKKSVTTTIAGGPPAVVTAAKPKSSMKESAPFAGNSASKSSPQVDDGEQDSLDFFKKLVEEDSD